MSRHAHLPARPDVPDRTERDAPNILRALLAVQADKGHVPPASVSEIAGALGVTEALVAGVLSAYPDLRTRPAGRHVVRVCRGESCVANRCELVLKELEKKLGVECGGTTRDGRFTLDKVYCVGNCGASPTVMIGEDVYGRVSPGMVEALLKGSR